ncbi:MAG: hypothetical protein AABZ00_03880 [Chloroflexota bacterium]
MNKIQKRQADNIVKKTAENGKVKLGGKLGVDLEVTPWVVKGKGGLGIFFQMPTLFASDLLRKIAEHFKQGQNDQ